MIEHEAYVQLDLFVENKENNIDKINQDMNVEYFEDYAHLKVIFDKEPFELIHRISSFISNQLLT